MAPFRLAGRKGNELDYLPDFSICNPRLGGRPLSETERTIFFDRLRKLVDSDALIIYRGDNKATVLKRYNNSSIPHPFNDYLFMLGTKGKYFFEEVQKKVAGSKDIFPISDTSQKFFGKIFDMLTNLFNTSPHSFTERLRYRFEKFIEREAQVSIFFKDRAHRKAFMEKIKDAGEKDKVLIRDYYLNLLHHFGKSEFYPTSFLLSATTSFDVAKSFVRNEILDENEIIFFGWVPKGNRDMMLHTSQYNFIRRRVLERYNLPMYQMSFFPRQKEITLKGAFLPHYMIGYFYTEAGEKRFEINPALFEEIDVDWLKNGFPIDQSLFFSKAGKVGLGKGVYVDQDGNFGDINLK